MQLVSNQQMNEARTRLAASADVGGPNRRMNDMNLALLSYFYTVHY